jgi:hypothetical protein
MDEVKRDILCLDRKSYCEYTLIIKIREGKKATMHWFVMYLALYIIPPFSNQLIK